MSINGKVAKILDKHSLVATVGEEDGVEPGMKFQIYQKGEMIRHPDTGEQIGNAPSVEKGVVIAADVLDNMTVMEGEREMKTVEMDFSNFTLPFRDKKTVIEQEEIDAVKDVPEDRTKVEEGDRVRLIEEEEEAEEEEADSEITEDSEPVTED